MNTNVVCDILLNFSILISFIVEANVSTAKSTQAHRNRRYQKHFVSGTVSNKWYEIAVTNEHPYFIVHVV